MEYTTLGRTGLQISKLCFGTMSFGNEADEATAAAMFARCREAGINFFDCANIYSQGKAEEILGRLIEGCRDELVITSKVGQSMSDSRLMTGLSRRSIMQNVEATLSRLRTDRLDVYFCHCFDAKTPIDETLGALEDLRRQGKVLYAGVSNWSAWQTALAVGRADGMGIAGLHVLQPMYNLAKRTAEVEILPLALAEKLGVIGYSPLGGGLLTGKYRGGTESKTGRLAVSAMYATRYADAHYHAIADAFCDYAARHGVSPVTLAVAWAGAHPAMTAPIIGARDLAQLEPSLAAADMVLSAEQWREIADLAGPLPVATGRDEERG